MGEAIQITLEVGHKAHVKEKPDLKGNTHDWNVFIRASESQSIEKLINKVVFTLHETFKKPQRGKLIIILKLTLKKNFKIFKTFPVIKSPPYSIKESGYGQFEFPIQIYFNGTDEVYKVDYYLELQATTDKKTFCKLRRETLTFYNPKPELRKILIESGGIVKKIDSATTPTSLNSLNSFNSLNVVHAPTAPLFNPADNFLFNTNPQQPSAASTASTSKKVSLKSHFFPKL